MTDAHRVVHDDTTEPGCWAGDSEYRACGATAVSNLGLCGPHLAELRGDTPPPVDTVPRAAGAHATFVVTDETAPPRFPIRVMLGTEPAANEQIIRRILGFTSATWGDGW